MKIGSQPNVIDTVPIFFGDVRRPSDGVEARDQNSGARPLGDLEPSAVDIVTPTFEAAVSHLMCLEPDREVGMDVAQPMLDSERRPEAIFRRHAIGTPFTEMAFVHALQQATDHPLERLDRQFSIRIEGQRIVGPRFLDPTHKRHATVVERAIGRSDKGRR